MGYNVTYKVLKLVIMESKKRKSVFVGLRKDKFNDKYFEYPNPVDHIIGTEALCDLPSLDNNEDATKYKTSPQNDFQRLMRKIQQL